MTDCPRRIEINGKPRLVPCRRWNCSKCSERMATEISDIIRLQFRFPIAVGIRGSAEHNLMVVWKRIRMRIAKESPLKYVAVIERSPDEHLHALIEGCTPEEFERHARAAGAQQIYAEPVRDKPAYCDYLLSKRLQASTRISHSRDLTQPLKGKTHDRRTNEVMSKARAYAAQTPYENPDFSAQAYDIQQSRTQAHGTTHIEAEEVQAAAVAPPEAQAGHRFTLAEFPSPNAAETFTARQPEATLPDHQPCSERDSDCAARHLQQLIAAARATARHTLSGVTITITVNP